MKLNDLYDELSLSDIKRLRVRASAKVWSSDRKKEVEYSIFFPKTIVSKSDVQARTVLSWLFNGFILKFDTKTLVVDPGVGFYLRASESGFNLDQMDFLYVSHLHLDHSADANVTMDFAIRKRMPVKIFAPKSVFTSKTVDDFHSARKTRFPVVHSSEIINSRKVFDLGDGTKMSFMKLHHGVECYGFKLQNREKTVVYVSDTGPFRSLRNFVKGSDVLIINIDSFLSGKNSKTHLSVVDFLREIDGLKFAKIILAHINPLGELEPAEWGEKIANYVELKTGVKTIYPGVRGASVDF